LDDLDVHAKAILKAIVNGHDIFQSSVADQSVLICDSFAETRRTIRQGHATTHVELQQSVIRVERKIQEEHLLTRCNVQKEGDRVIISNENGNRALSRSIELATGNLQDALDSKAEANAIQHDQTRAQIVELQEALRQLSEQIEARDRQLAFLLTDLSKTTKEKRRKRLQEQSNAVTAAIVALQTMYCRFLVCAPNANSPCTAH
jgi:hypothetical protein